MRSYRKHFQYFYPILHCIPILPLRTRFGSFTTALGIMWCHKVNYTEIFQYLSANRKNMLLTSKPISETKDNRFNFFLGQGSHDVFTLEVKIIHVKFWKKKWNLEDEMKKFKFLTFLNKTRHIRQNTTFSSFVEHMTK